MSLIALVSIYAILGQDVQVLMQVVAKTFKSKCKSWPGRASLNASLGQDFARLRNVKSSRKKSEMTEKTSKTGHRSKKLQKWLKKR